MKFAAQRWFGEVGESACYALSIIALAESFARRPWTIGDVALFIEDAILKKYIYYNEKDHTDPNNFLVEHPDSMLKDLTKINWAVRKVNENVSSFVASPDELVIYQYRRVVIDKKGKKITYLHFCTPTYDPLGDSLTRTQGELYSLRVFRRS